jgi:arginyl-tRNA synthetase
MKSISSRIEATVKELFDTEVTVQLDRPDSQFGDFATNVALQLAKPLAKNPREIAEAIADNLRATDAVSEVTVAGPGFINVRLSASGLISLMRQEPLPTRAGKTIVIETNNPNPFKAMHIGHGFNAVLADTIANLLAVSGAKVHRVSYHGDIGLHVGRSMYSLLRYAAGDMSKIEAVPAAERNSFMSKMYAEGSRAYKEDDSAKQEITQLTEQSFNPGNELYGKIYELCKQWSFEQIDLIVARLGNIPIEQRFLESAADARGVQTVREHVPEVFQESDGALIFKGSEHGSFDNVFVGRNGRGLYAARDLGLMQLKAEAYHADYSYIVTAEEQRDYFKGVIAAAGLVWPDQKDSTINISTGTVKLSTGKMSSRDGDVVEIAWLFDEFANAIKERGGDPTDEIVAGALRYQFLKVKVGSDVIFDINEAVSLSGNTGSYIQYAHARAKSILAKATAQAAPLSEVYDEDRSLVRKLGEYHEVIARAAGQLEPHHICTYLFELAQEFNRYYEQNRVIGDEHEGHRLGLVASYADTLNAGLSVLGVHAPDNM